MEWVLAAIRQASAGVVDLNQMSFQPTSRGRNGARGLISHAAFTDAQLCYNIMLALAGGRDGGIGSIGLSRGVTLPTAAGAIRIELSSTMRRQLRDQQTQESPAETAPTPPPAAAVVEEVAGTDTESEDADTGGIPTAVTDRQRDALHRNRANSLIRRACLTPTHQPNIDAVIAEFCSPENASAQVVTGFSNRCLICQGPYEIGQALVRLPCMHLAHIWCCRRWFASEFERLGFEEEGLGPRCVECNVAITVQLGDVMG